MEHFKLFLCILVLVHYSANGQVNKVKGLSFVASTSPITQFHVTPVDNICANYVALMPFGFSMSLTSPEIGFNTTKQWFGETAAGVRQYAEQFRKHKIQVMIKPQIWVWNGDYTGFIEMNSEDDWQELEMSYEKFILLHAALAEELQAPIFCIGTELEKFVLARPDYWNRLIGKIRAIYHGKLTYAANWNEFANVSFWNQLDYIGIDAYFPLTHAKNPSLEDYEKGWAVHKKQIEMVQKKLQKPILFTEFGYRSIDYAGKEPWNSSTSYGQINHQAQVNGLQALYNYFWLEDWFIGGFVWKWFYNNEQVGGENDNRFTPQNKPAAALLKKIYED